MEKRVIKVNERLPLLMSLPLSLQHLFAMFGATILVPFLFKADPTTCIFLNGVGTLIYIFLTKGKVPAYLGSSFAVISPVLLVLQTMPYSAAQGGFVVFGLIYLAFALLIKKIGTGWIDVIFPPAAMGAIVAIIGLELAPTAAAMAGLTDKVPNYAHIGVAFFTLITTVIATVAFRGFLAIIPILFGVASGYVAALVMGMVDFTPVINAPWFQVPHFQLPTFEPNAILIIIPAVMVTLAEHIGHLIVTGNIIGEDLVNDPGLPRSLSGDGIATALAGFFGGTPNTTYGENIGVLALTKVYSVWVIGGAAVLAMLLSFIGKLSELIRSIPSPVMGGVCMLLFGVIAVSGIRIFVDRNVDFTKSHNMVMTATIMIIGLSGAKVTFGTVTIQGMVLATIVAVLMSVLFKVIGIREDD
jgi:uracil permease